MLGQVYDRFFISHWLETWFSVICHPLWHGATQALGARPDGPRQMRLLGAQLGVYAPLLPRLEDLANLSAEWGARVMSAAPIAGGFDVLLLTRSRHSFFAPCGLQTLREPSCEMAKKYGRPSVRRRGAAGEGVAPLLAQRLLPIHFCAPPFLATGLIEAKGATGHALVRGRGQEHPVSADDRQRPALAWNLRLPGDVLLGAPVCCQFLLRADSLADQSPRHQGHRPAPPMPKRKGRTVSSFLAGDSSRTLMVMVRAPRGSDGFCAGAYGLRIEHFLPVGAKQ